MTRVDSLIRSVGATLRAVAQVYRDLYTRDLLSLVPGLHPS